MKKNSLLFLVLMTSIAVNATIRRVNNNPGINANFSNFTAAQNASSANDTLFFEGSATPYGNIAITKQLVIIGPGYFLEENPETQATKITAKFGTIGFNAGCSGSVLTGVEVQGIITINVSNINIVRCNTKTIVLNSTTTPIGNLLFLNNYILAGGTDDGIKSSGTNTIFNVVVSNNYLSGFYNSITLGVNSAGVLSNNIFVADVVVSNFTFINNIQKGGTLSLKNNVFFNNIGSGTQFPAGNGNQQSINMTDIFVGLPGNSTDGQWQLKTGSPAIGAGNDGTNCGMFGGPTPYVLSGLPQIPAIYEINMPASGNNNKGINVTVKAKSH